MKRRGKRRLKKKRWRRRRNGQESNLESHISGLAIGPTHRFPLEPLLHMARSSTATRFLKPTISREVRIKRNDPTFHHFLGLL